LLGHWGTTPGFHLRPPQPSHQKVRSVGSVCDGTRTWRACTRRQHVP
jgi:hypothetical protein